MIALKRLSFEDLRASLWFLPAVASVAAFVVAQVLVQWEPEPQTALARRLWPGDTEGARTMLQVVATVVVTATSLTFSLVVVALQLASQQFSPRLLREFARDWVIQVVLSTLVGTFVYALTVLRGIDASRPLAAPAVLVGFLLGMVSVAALIAFVGHIVRALRVDTMMVAVHAETAATISEFYPPYDDDRYGDPDRDVPGPTGGTLLPAGRSGFLKVIDIAGLVEVARRHDVVLWLHLSPGDHVVRGTPLASAWPTGGGPLRPELADDVAATLEMGYERTAEQDVGLGIRQLTDIAVKALSPSVNDPTTASHAIGYAADLLTRLCDRRLGAQVRRDADGTPRLVLRDRDFAYYVDLACAQVRRYAHAEPTALMALLRLLRATAVAARDDAQRRAVEEQALLVVEEADDDLAEADCAAVLDLHRRVLLALAGDADGAYVDSAGQTRSS